MKKIIFLGILAAMVCFAAPMAQTAWADDGIDYSSPEKKPEKTADSYIGMIFYKLTGRLPDFESWARNTDEYRNAASLEKLSVQDKIVQQLRSTYSLLTLQEPVIVETPVKLSEYSTANKGFFAESFKEETFFPFSYNNQSYAVVPRGIMDRQWLKVPDAATAKAIENAGRLKPLMMTFILYPKYADGSAPVTMDGESYWLISAEINKMILYPQDSSIPLWQSDGTGADDEKLKELLKLRQ